jgi:WhiB family redox-sensing transcriptional regulator
MARGRISFLLYSVDPGWHDYARCNTDETVDPNLFYPSSGHPDTAAKAVKFCEPCPVKMECLAFSIATRQRYGVWGGMVESKRRKMFNMTPKQRKEFLDAQGSSTAERRVG